MKYLNAFKNVQKTFEKFNVLFDNCVSHNALDKYEWGCILDASPNLKKMSKVGSKIYDKYDTVMEDLYYLLYKYDPQFIDELSLNDNVGFINKSVMQQIKESSPYEELKSYTVGDEINSAISVIELSDTLKEKVKEKVEELEKAKQQIQELMDQLKDSLKDVKHDDDLTDEQKQQIEQLMELMSQASNLNLDPMTVAQNLENLIESAKKNEELAVTWGLAQSDSFMKLPHKDKFKLYETIKNNEKLRKVTEMLGKMKTIISTDASTKISKEISSLEGLTKSNEIIRATPAELIKLSDDDHELLFYNNFANYDLDTFDYENDVEEIRGPIVIAIDESGSMFGMNDIWAKACALAVIQQAQIQKRSVFVIHFASQSSAKNLKVHKFLKDEELDVPQLIDMVQFFYNGGTNFDPPLNRMLECVDTEKEFEKAHGLFISDGECRVSQKLLDKIKSFKHEKNFKILGILVNYGGHTSLNEFCDSVLKISEISESTISAINNHIQN